LPEVVGVPPERVSKCGGRLEIQPGSFFEAVPAACDAYIAKHIIHDWSDEHFRKVLRLMGGHLPATGRVLICDMVMPEDPAPNPAKVRDIEMLVMTPGGRERTACKPNFPFKPSAVV
jgi:O-methyltransferase domain